MGDGYCLVTVGRLVAGVIEKNQPSNCVHECKQNLIRLQQRALHSKDVKMPLS